ncbi:MAG: H-NS histone family protein [Methylibium sp.]|uniref:H-NS histone family protein n=2 Tax=unclassified Methylibium TaxID=2633235 RepID=UPI001F4925C6|nr:H-NS histone family protein [Methylibium sp. Root1272]MDP1791930.1 H-NS histone family protein [Methylibium sp.]
MRVEAACGCGATTLGDFRRFYRRGLMLSLTSINTKDIGMAKSLAQIQKEIATLQRQAETLKKREVKDVIERIREAIAFYGLSAADLGLGAAGRKQRKVGAKKKKQTKTIGKVKYRDDAGHSWSGHGRRPQWFLDAIAGGKTPEDLAA